MVTNEIGHGTIGHGTSVSRGGRHGPRAHNLLSLSRLFLLFLSLASLFRLSLSSLSLLSLAPAEFRLDAATGHRSQEERTVVMS